MEIRNRARYTFAFLFVTASLIASAADNLVPNGSFESADCGLSAFRCANDGGAGGRFELFVEDLTWNRCGKLTAGRVHDEMGGGKPLKVCSGCVTVGGADGRALAVEPGTVYEYAFDLKGKAGPVYLSFREFETVDGKVRPLRKGMQRIHEAGKDWRHASGTFRTDPKADHLELSMLIWTQTYPEKPGPFAEGDFILIDNVSFVRSERHARLAEMLAKASGVRVAPYPVEADPSCPFLPVELAEPPTQIVFRAAVNEKKALPIAIGNMTDRFAQYRVVLETEPGNRPGINFRLDNGEFGLAGFPPEKITVREALRFKDSDEDPVAMRLDPLVGMNEASVISVPPREAGAVWFDFDTYDVKPGTYCGRLRVIPLGEGATYIAKGDRYVRERSGERIVPVEFTVDPIALPRESVRPAHFCSDCQSEQDFGLEADLGVRIYALSTYFFVPEASGDPKSEFHRTVADYKCWAGKRGVTVNYFVKYDALRASQAIFNKKNDPGRKWAAWEDYVCLIAKLMDEAAIPFEDYYVLVRDEPTNAELEEVREAHRRLKALYPKMRTYVSCGYKIMGKVNHIDVLGDTTDLWAMEPCCYATERQAEERRELKRRYGTQFLHYRCDTRMRLPLADYFRRHCWRSERYGLDADMLYQFNIYNRGLRGELSLKIAPQGEVSYKLDGRFFPSVRYMAYREGVTDIKYLQALREARGNEPEVAKFLRDAAAEVVDRGFCPAEVPAALREKAAAMILEAKKGGTRK